MKFMFCVNTLQFVCLQLSLATDTFHSKAHHEAVAAAAGGGASVQVKARGLMLLF
jgi:hypothetical protein